MLMSPSTVRLTVSDILDQRKMTTRELADAAGISYNTALSYRRGVNARIDFETLARLCDALGVHPGELFEITPEPTP